MGYQNTVNVLTRSLYPYKLGPFKINKKREVIRSRDNQIISISCSELSSVNYAVALSFGTLDILLFLNM